MGFSNSNKILKNIDLHSDSFGGEVKYYLKKMRISVKEMAIRARITPRYLTQLFNNEHRDIFASVIEAMENAFDLKSGDLFQVYKYYNSKKLAIQSQKLDYLFEKFGINFLIKHPEFSQAIKIAFSEDMNDIAKLMILKRFYGVYWLEDYIKILDTIVISNHEIYRKRPNALVWIRYCELQVERIKNLPHLGIFRSTNFTYTFEKILSYMCIKEYSFAHRIALIKNFLAEKGIVLITKTYIEDSFVRAITLKKGLVRYIFLSDMHKNEGFIFFALLHEIIHTYYPNKKEDEVNIFLKNAYEEWKAKNEKHEIVALTKVCYLRVKAGNYFEISKLPSEDRKFYHDIIKNHQYVKFEE
ncbi:hypothetical protein FJO69_01820 [[Mycoplasma] falconis]|uniref:HTH cro/C1-type domain-containing protein n=1 Tax=[Mycoplasma] falconis TaxID=92403 RepID=A0A501XA45_9BACT|nr:hypothetical protein [[Mycoplasma] falconis]TPE57346.1 hypothetical protein FJO69_01820 [[Mycoplasma] falconis]